MTEQELRSAIRSSRKEGYRLLFQQYYPYVYRIVWNQIRTVGTKEDTEECVNDIFSELFSIFDKVRDGTLHGFIGILARRRAIDLYRLLIHRECLTSLDDENVVEIASDEQIEENVEANRQQKILYHHIQSLGEPDATIIMLKFFYDCNSVEISEKVHMNPITVRVHINRALKRLKKLLLSDRNFIDRG